MHGGAWAGLYLAGDGVRMKLLLIFCLGWISYDLYKYFKKYKEGSK